MNYPFWDTGVGYGILMASIAVVHVFISHFAIGGGLYLVVAEQSARRRRDTYRLEFLYRLSKFFALVSLVFGALTGVGIWFVIGLLNPAATEVLIHNFVWVWAVEWTCFCVEITAAIIYYHGWKRMSARDHLRIGWIYFVSAWLSLFAINGIVAFMLTPGHWIKTGGFWEGFFNPTFWPALVFRTGICILLAGVYANLVASRDKRGPGRTAIIRLNSGWILAGIAVIIPAGVWYWGSIPPAITRAAAETMKMPAHSIEIARRTLGVLAVLTIVFGLLLPKRMNTVVAALAMAASLGFFGSFEWMRESIRKPYVIYGYMYGNAVEVSKTTEYQRDGYLAHIKYRTGDDGADLFRHACRSCHTIDGYRPLAPQFSGTNPDFIASIVRNVDLLRGNMPPFLGTPDEAKQIASRIWAEVDHTPLLEKIGRTDVSLGKEVWRVYCGKCHEPGGYRDVTETLTGLDDDELDDIFDNGADYGDGMPNFTGTHTERAALILYIRTLTGEDPQ